jgi:hypothetical protein
MTKLEEIARAIMRRRNANNPRFDLEEWIEAEAMMRHGGDASAAVEAMREPTEVMVEAAYARQEKTGCPVQAGLNYSAIYETMIDSILSEGTGK